MSDTLTADYIVPLCTEQVGILHEDDAILVVHKPAFLLSVPGRSEANKDCVISRLDAIYPGIKLVHRLDLDTSGLMVFARTREAQASLSRAFQQRQVSKAYDAVVAGLVSDDQGTISLPLIADWPRRPRQKVCHQSGKQALTHFEVQQRYPELDCTHLQLRPVTGRSHQLRIHCRELGHAIIGCDLYAPDHICARSPRLLLHASALAFHHPDTGEWSVFESPAPFLDDNFLASCAGVPLAP